MAVCSYISLKSIDLKGINSRFQEVYKEVCYLKAISGTGGAGVGTIDAGVANRLTYYAAGGTTVTQLPAITANRALISSASGLPIAASVTNTELGYVSGVTSAVQSQIDSKASLSSPTFTGTPAAPTAPLGTNTTQIATMAAIENALEDSTIYFGSTFTGTGTALNPIEQEPVYFSSLDFAGAGTIGDPITLLNPGGSQTPWTSDIDADQFELNNVKALEVKIETAGSPTYALWNSADKAAGITLTGANLIATGSGGALEIVRANQSAIGSKYWEVTIVTTGNHKVGISNLTESLANTLGDSANSYGYQADGQKKNGGSTASYGATYDAGDVIGVAYNSSAGTIEFFKNNVSQGTAYTGISGTFYPAHSFGFSTGQATVNFGATAFTYTPPSGYTGVFTSGGGGTSEVFKTDGDGNVIFGNVQEFTDNTTALGGGLTVGMIYRTGDNLKIVH